jgi:hypothetical protein
VDLAGGLGRGRPAPHRPSAHLVLTHGEEALQAQQVIRELDHAVEAGLDNAVFLQEHFGLFRRELGDLHF